MFIIVVRIPLMSKIQNNARLKTIANGLWLFLCFWCSQCTDQSLRWSCSPRPLIPGTFINAVFFQRTLRLVISHPLNRRVNWASKNLRNYHCLRFLLLSFDSKFKWFFHTKLPSPSNPQVFGLGFSMNWCSPDLWVRGPRKVHPV